MVFSSTGSAYSNTSGTPSDLTSVSSVSASTAYRVYIRVKVCDASTAAGGVESNCVLYGSNYKPEGLLQQYANKIRYSAFSYLNAQGTTQQGGVMRAPMGFIGPTYPAPLSTTVVTNTRAEWDSSTGIMKSNPDTSSATASGVSNSGVMNYLNQFGQTAKTYMTYDNVSELYYAVVRYFENLGNVAEWTNAVASGVSDRATKLDGFPALTSWTDPITYSCQKNFVLGIGDNHTHYDYNVGGATATGGRAKPSAVSSDTLNKAETWTKNLQALEGLTQTPWWGVGGTSSTYYIAGLAYGTHVNDIRSDLTGTQTLSTYWMDVMEYQRAEDRNPYWLAAKYGGMSSEAIVAGKVMWEFTDSTMGYSYGAPIVVKTRKYGWVMVLSSGYNNSDGYGYLYFVHPKTGALLEKVRTGTASSGLAQASAYVQDYTHNTADAIYVADLNGQLWRFDVTAAKASTAAYPAPTLLATLTDASGNAQPVTTAPLVEIHPTTRKRFVLFGTGKLLDSTDVSSSALQSFYAILDGTASAFGSSAGITRADFLGVSDVTAGISLSSSAKGWYIDLGASSGVGWRVVASPVAYNGVVAFTSLLTTGDACSPSGQSRVYAVNYATGKSVLSDNTTGYVSSSSAITDLRFVSVDGTVRLVAGNTGGEIKKIDADLTSSISLRLLHWREVPTVD